MSDANPQSHKSTGAAGAPPQIPDHELLRCIGRGAYGEVWLARNIMGTWRAVKVVYRRSFEDDRPFEREFNGIQKFEPISRAHDSQVDILHVGRTADYFYYVMELADDENRGQEIDPDTYRPKTLKSETRRRGALPVDECVSIGLQLTTALAHLHGEGLIHRDIKPSNIIFIQGVPKLADIGLVTSTDATISFVGTQGFYPPEGPGTPQADIYSLGKVLYELFWGRDRQDFPELPTGLAEHPERERLLELNAIVARACAPELKNRYNSAEAIRQDFLLIQGGASVRRVRQLEQRIFRLARVGAVLGTLMILATLAFVLQKRETRLAKTIADQKADFAAASQRQLAQHEISTGNRLVEQGDYHMALLWFADALKRITPGSKEESIHRIRIQAILDRAPRLLNVMKPDEPVDDVQFSPDGRFFVTTTGGGKHAYVAHLWNTETGEAISSFSAHIRSLNSPVFSNDSKRLVTCGWPEGLIVWNLPSATPAFTMQFEEWERAYAALSPDGRRLIICGQDGRFNFNGQAVARIWDIDRNVQIGPALEHGSGILQAAFSPDGRLALTVGIDPIIEGREQYSICIWKTETGELVSTLRNEDQPFCAVFSPDSKHVATQGRTISIWTIGNNQRIECKISGTEAIRAISSASFSPDGTRIVASLGDRTARVWDTQTGLELGATPRQGGPIERAIFSPDGSRILTTCQDGRMRVWDLKGREQAVSPMNQSEFARTAAFHPDGRRVLSAGLSLKLWDVSSRAEQKTSFQTDETSGFPCFSPTGKQLAYCQQVQLSNELERAIVTLRELSTGKESLLHEEVVNLESDTKAVQWKVSAHNYGSTEITRGYSAVSFSPDGRFILASGDSYLHLIATPRLWDASSGKEITTFGNQTNSGDACFSPNGAMVAVAGLNGEVTIWDTRGQALTQPLRSGDPLVKLSFSPDSRWLLTGSDDGTARVWDISTQKLVLGPLKHTNRIRSVQFTPDGKHFAVRYGRSEVSLWSVTNGKQPVASFDSMWNPISFNASRRWMLTQPTRTSLTIRDYLTGEKIRTEPRQVWFSHAEFSRGGDLYATASYDGRQTQVWETETGQPVTPPLEHMQTTWFAGLSPSASQLLTINVNEEPRRKKSTFTLWDLVACRLSVDAVVDLAETLSSYSLEPTGSYAPLSAEALVSKHRTLRTRHPELFSRTEATR